MINVPELFSSLWWLFILMFFISLFTYSSYKFAVIMRIYLHVFFYRPRSVQKRIKQFRMKLLAVRKSRKSNEKLSPKELEVLDYLIATSEVAINSLNNKTDEEVE